MFSELDYIGYATIVSPELSVDRKVMVVVGRTVYMTNLVNSVAKYNSKPSLTMA